MPITYGQNLMTGERIKLAFYIEQTPDEQRRIYAEAKQFPGGESGCLIHAYQALDEFLGWPLGMNERPRTIQVEPDTLGTLCEATDYAVENRNMDARSLDKDGEDESALQARDDVDEWDEALGCARYLMNNGG